MSAEYDDMVSKVAAAEAERRKISVAAIGAAGRIAFERECQRAGVDPALGVSPSLYRLLGRTPPKKKVDEIMEQP